jgi:nucleoside-diphosphate-sugar epimerase
LIAEASGSELKPEHAPTRDGEVRLSQGDGSRAGELLEWSPQWLLADGVRECVRQRDLVDALA